MKRIQTVDFVPVDKGPVAGCSPDGSLLVLQGPQILGAFYGLTQAPADQAMVIISRADLANALHEFDLMMMGMQD
jgi:hypothetical protein